MPAKEVVKAISRRVPPPLLTLTYVFIKSHKSVVEANVRAISFDDGLHVHTNVSTKPPSGNVSSKILTYAVYSVG